LWVPSHSGWWALRLQPQNHTLPVAVARYSTGVNAVTLCAPSQNGCLCERPQAHYQ